MKAILLAAIRAYQYLLSPWVGGACRFWPTCSEYAGEAIERHGALRGSWMMLARLARCHPRGKGGVEPVPEQFCWRCWQCSTRAGQTDATAQTEAPCAQPVPSIPPMPAMATRRDPR